MRLSALSGIALLSLTAALATGCSSIQKNQDLIEAEELFAQAKQDESLLKYAPNELDRAQKALNLAAEAKSDEEMSSLAYIGKTRTETAKAIAERKMAKVKLEELSKIKDTERLRARELEISESKAKAAALQKQLEELEAVKTERGMVMTLGDVLFATGKADLQPGAMSTINRLAEFLAEYPNKTLLIEGHTDSVGTDAYNQGLSDRRALAVRTALIQANVDPGRITTVGYGEARPIADNNTAEGRLKNRRVEIIIRN